MPSDPAHGLVLVLEDDPRLAAALALLLQDWGYECAAGRRLEDLLPILQSRGGEVRAVVSDYHLADGVTGVAAAKAMAARGLDPPVLLLTGTLRGAARRTAQAEGYVFLDKPVAPERLRRLLHRMVMDGHKRST